MLSETQYTYTVREKKLNIILRTVVYKADQLEIDFMYAKKKKQVRRCYNNNNIIKYHIPRHRRKPNLLHTMVVGRGGRI